MVSENKPTVIRTVKLKEALIELVSDRYVRVLFYDNVVLDLEVQNRLLEGYLEICKGEKYPFLFEAMENLTVTKEARENAVKLEEKAPVLRSAVIANSLPYRMIANFYLKFNKPKTPFKVFSNKQDALKWLLGKK